MGGWVGWGSLSVDPLEAAAPSHVAVTQERNPRTPCPWTLCPLESQLQLQPSVEARLGGGGDTAGETSPPLTVGFTSQLLGR